MAKSKKNKMPEKDDFPTVPSIPDVSADNEAGSAGAFDSAFTGDIFSPSENGEPDSGNENIFRMSQSESKPENGESVFRMTGDESEAESGAPDEPDSGLDTENVFAAGGIGNKQPETIGPRTKTSADAEIIASYTVSAESAPDDDAAGEPDGTDSAVDTADDVSDGTVNISDDNTTGNKTKKSGATEKKSPLHLVLSIAAVLTIICAFVSVLLVFINIFTNEKISQNDIQKQKEAVLSIFKNADSVELYDSYEGKEKIYLAFIGKNICGYCVNLNETGFGGDINMTVGIDGTGSVVGVRIISMSETPGLGTKTRNDSFLSQFINPDAKFTDDGGAPFSIGENVDAISGATVSSQAVTNGVNRAMSLGISLYNISISRRINIVAPDYVPSGSDITIESPSGGTTPASSNPADELIIKGETAFDRNNPPFGNQYNPARPGFEVDYEPVTTVQKIETARPFMTSTAEGDEPEPPVITPAAPATTPAQPATTPAVTAPVPTTTPAPETTPVPETTPAPATTPVPGSDEVSPPADDNGSGNNNQGGGL